ncbi:MAG: triphosphoribosyl-dephospho-CoA synthase, partial [Defluviitaleaceae bacterium]|nr:triphosphoribosyl-dephospho-CoA synthase [Defluviitaleaceae bacterium]
MTFADKMAELAVRALITEVCITPKPGLVDRANNGAHRDMNVFTFIDSALTLHGYFRCITSLSQTHEDDGLLLKLQPLGLQAEQDMFRVTKGVNTHKGAIFSLGLICAAAAVLERQSIKQTDEILSQTCADIVRSRSRLRDAEKAAEKGAATKGELVYKRHGLRG